MNVYVIVTIAAIVLIAILRRLQSGGFGATPVDPSVPRTEEGVKRLFAEGHLLQAIRLAQEIAAHDPARARAILEELQIQVKIGASGDTATTIAGMLEPAKDREIQMHLLSGNKIDAIKRWRDLTGQGLKESKDAIDRLADRGPT